MRSGIVFDIQRFALHDGPGIRTTVFLKGCPLRCTWCHNPESQAPEPQLSFRSDLCTPSCVAVETCRSGAHRVVDGRHEVDFSVPAEAHTCTSSCPHGASTIVGRRMSVDEVMAEVVRDVAYFERSGGGVTLSGGEPLAQPDFSVALLAAARDRGLHTCLDTCGVTSRDRLARAAEFVDLFYFDYKATDPDEHQRLTGARNERLLDNLDHLYRQGHAIVLRCPLIPGHNDTEEHLRGIAALSARYPDLRGITLLPYHRMGRDKAARVGMDYPLGDLPSADDATQQRWLTLLAQAGCTRAELAA